MEKVNMRPGKSSGDSNPFPAVKSCRHKKRALRRRSLFERGGGRGGGNWARRTYCMVEHQFGHFKHGDLFPAVEDGF